MRKISFSLSRKSGIFSLIAVVALFLVGIGSLVAANLNIGSSTTISYSGTGTKYYYTPEEDGTLTIKLTPETGYSGVNFGEGGDTYILYNYDGSPVTALSSNGENVGAPFLVNTTEATFHVEAYNNYYVQLSAWAGTVMATFEAGGDSGSGGGGGSETDLQLPVDGTTWVKCEWSGNNKYYYTPSENGVLTMSSSSYIIIGNYNLLYTEAGSPVEIAEDNAEDMGGVMRANSVKWNLEGGQKYYFQYPDQVDEGNVKFSFEAGGGTVDPEPEPEPDPDGYSDMAMQSYAVSGVGGVMLKYTPETNGVLTAVQTGSFDSHLFSAAPVYNDSYGYDNNYGIMISPDGGEYSGTNPYTLKYTLSKGETYYFVAKLMTGDGLSNVTFSWTPAQASTNVIPEDVVTSVKGNTVYTFTPSATGKLTVGTSLYSSDLYFAGQQMFFFKNAACTQKVDMLSIPDDSSIGGYEFYFSVEAGKTYYVKIDTLSPVNMLFEVTSETIVPKFTGVSGIETVPGGAIGRDAQEATFGLDFEPQGVTITSVDFIYTDASGQQQTIKNVEFSTGGGKYQIPLPLHFDSNGKRLSTGDGTGSVMSLIAGAEIYYQINGMSYNGTPVDESTVTEGVELLGDGAIKIKFLVANPVKLVSYTLPSPFLQYWPVGSGDATATFTFDGDITGRGENSSIEISVNQGNLVFGAVGGEESASVSIPWDNASIETVSDGDDASHSVLTVNFAGVDMTSIPAGNASIVLIGVAGTDGLLANMSAANSSADGSAAFYTTMVTAEIPEGTVTVKGTDPAQGEELKVDENGKSTFTIEFSDNAKITRAYAPTKPEYTDCEFQIVTGDSDTGYGTVWSVTFPESYVEEMVNDGLGLSCNIEAVAENGTPIGYGNDELIVLSFAPDASLTPGIDFEVMVAESEIGILDTFRVLAPLGYDYMEANDYNTGYENPYQGITITGENGFEAHPVADAFADGVVTFTPGITESGTYTINFPLNAFTIGATAGQGSEGDVTKMSAAKSIEFNVTISQQTQAVVTLNPESGSAIDVAEDGTVSFVLTASQPVCLTEYQYGRREGELIVTPTPGEDVFETNYTLTFPKSYIDNAIYGWDATSGLPRSIFATLYMEDENGDKVVRTGENGTTYDDFSIYYTLNIDAPQGAPFGVKVAEEAKGSLSSFEVYPLDGFSYVMANDETTWDDEAGYTNYYQNITISGENFTAHAVGLQTEKNEDGDDVPVFNGTVNFDPAITNSGTYTITIPYHAFTVGQEAAQDAEGDVTYWSQFKEVEFTVVIKDVNSGVAEILGVEGACKVYNLNGVLVLDTENAADLNQLENGIYIINGKKVMIRK